eukprot:GHVT01080880.1.p1 GENE.GHVT01080880.1~~GHVT01080880.1.p1  ORF type:complete len:467 (-),score=84.83 GHVT01080880.1:130-1530(-)
MLLSSQLSRLSDKFSISPKIEEAVIVMLAKAAAAEASLEGQDGGVRGHPVAGDMRLTPLLTARQKAQLATSEIEALSSDLEAHNMEAAEEANKLKAVLQAVELQGAEIRRELHSFCREFVKGLDVETQMALPAAPIDGRRSTRRVTNVSEEHGARAACESSQARCSERAGGGKKHVYRCDDRGSSQPDGAGREHADGKSLLEGGTTRASRFGREWMMQSINRSLTRTSWSLNPGGVPRISDLLAGASESAIASCAAFGSPSVALSAYKHFRSLGYEQKLSVARRLIQQVDQQRNTLKKATKQLTAHVYDTKANFQFIDYHQLRIKKQQNATQLEQASQVLLELKRDYGRVTNRLNGMKRRLQEASARYKSALDQLGQKKQQVNKLNAELETTRKDAAAPRQDKEPPSVDITEGLEAASIQQLIDLKAEETELRKQVTVLQRKLMNPRRVAQQVNLPISLHACTTIT